MSDYQYFLRFHLPLGGLILILGLLFIPSGCSISPMDGQFACETNEDCPDGWICNIDGDARCYSETTVDTFPGSTESESDSQPDTSTIDTTTDTGTATDSDSTDSDSDTSTDTVTDTDSPTDSDTSSIADTDTGTETSTITDTETETTSDTLPDTETVTTEDTDTPSDSDTIFDTGTETDTGTDTHSEIDSDTGTDTGTTVDTETESDTGVDTDTGTTTDTEPSIPGYSCENPIIIDAFNAIWHGNWSDYQGAFAGLDEADCEASVTDIWFKLTIPANESILIRETTSSDVVLRELSDCDATGCVDASGNPEQYRVSNNTGVAADFYFMLSESPNNDADSITLTFEL